MEDVDRPRCVPGAAEQILWQLARCGLTSDEPVLWQSQRSAAYQAALRSLVERNLAYPCTCSRARIAQHFEGLGIARERFATLPYPGWCSSKTAHEPAPQAAWRLRTARTAATEGIFRGNSPLVSDFIHFNATDIIVKWSDAALGAQSQNTSQSVGDFVLKRADGLWAYQLAVVVDDAAQGITHVVRGADLADNTARQIWLQRCLNLPTPNYRHTPLVLAKDGQKLSKQNGAAELVLNTDADVLKALNAALAVLGLGVGNCKTIAELLGNAVLAWSSAYTARP